MLIRHFLNGQKTKKSDNGQTQEDSVPFVVGQQNEKIIRVVEKNVETLKEFLSQSDDIIEKQVVLGKSGLQASVMFIDGLMDNNMVSDTILRPLLEVDMAIPLSGYDLTVYTAKEVW